MSTPTTFAPYLNPELAQALLALNALWTDGGGQWTLKPGTVPDLQALIDGLTRAHALAPDTAAPVPSARVVAGALYVTPDSTTAAGTLYLTAASWHKLMLQWPASDAEGLALIAQAAQAAQRGDVLLKLQLNAAQWAAHGAALSGALGLVTAVADDLPSPVSDLFSLGAGIAAARGIPGAVIADSVPLDDGNRYARFGIAVNVDSAGDRSVLLGRALLESIRAIWPDAITGEVADVGGSSPIGVVRLDAAALGNRSVSDWLAALLQHGAIGADQVVYTAINGDPASLSAFNAAVRSQAFASSFPAPNPQTLLMPDALRDAVMAAVLQAAGAPLRAASAWLDLGRQALDSGVRQDGWIALDAGTRALVDPDRWPADNALLAAALRLQGTVRKTVVGLALSGTLDRALAEGEVLEIRVGDTVLSSAPGHGLSVEGSVWSLMLTDDGKDAWRDVSVTRVNGSTRAQVQSFAVLDEQATATVSVQAAALGRWYSQGSADLGQGVGALLAAAAAARPGDHGLDVIDIEALQDLLFDPALQRILASQGFVLPAQAIASQALADNAARINANGELHDIGGTLSATRETLLAWASRVRDGSGYTDLTRSTAVGEAGQLSRPTPLLGTTDRTAMEAQRDAAVSALTAFKTAQRTAVQADTTVELGLNLPDGATYTIEISTDGGATWGAVVDMQAVLAPFARTLVRVKDIVLPNNATSDTDLTLTASIEGAQISALSATTRLIDPARPRLLVEAQGSVEEEDGFAVFNVKLSDELTSDLDLDFSLQHGSTAAGDFGTGFDVSLDGGESWTPLSATTFTLPAGATALLVRHAVVADALTEGEERWSLQVNASGAGASALGNQQASGQAVLLDARPQSLSLRTRDVGQGEGEVGFELWLAQPARQAMKLQFVLQPGSVVDLNAHEVSLDGGKTWTALSFNAALQGDLDIAAGTRMVSLRSRIHDLAGDDPSGAVGLAVIDITGSATPLAAVEASARVWRHGSTPQLWVNDVNIDADSGEAVFTVRLSGASTVPVTVDYATALPASGAADPARDFLATSGRLVFGAGVIEQQVRVSLRQGWERLIDPRSFQLELGNPVNATVGDGSAMATLTGIRPGVVISGAQADETRTDSEGKGHAHFQVGLSHARSSSTTLFIEVEGDLADGDDDVGALQVFNAQTGVWDDYSAVNGVTLASGQTRLLVRAELSQRTPGALEADERLTLRVSADTASAAALATGTASAPLVLLGDTDLPSLVARNGTAGFGGEGVVFELSGSDRRWVSLDSAATGQLSAALAAAGLDTALLAQMQRVRPYAQGVLVTVVDANWLDQVRAVVDQHATNLTLRLQLDAVARLHADATASTASIDGAAGVNIGARNATSTALLDALQNLGLPVLLDAVGVTRAGLGAVVTVHEGGEDRYAVSRATLDFWGAELQRRYEREQAIDLRQRLALLPEGGAGVPVALGSSEAGGGGSADRWLAELGQAGVLLLDVSDNAFDPEAIGGIFRRRDTDGVDRLYVSEDTLASWSEQLAVRAALATSTYNGGLEQFADTYLRDKATFDVKFPLRTPDLSKLRIAYSTNTLVRNIFWYWKDMAIERVHYVSNEFYRRLSQLEQIGQKLDEYMKGEVSAGATITYTQNRLQAMDENGFIHENLPFDRLQRRVDKAATAINAYKSNAVTMQSVYLAYKDLLAAHGKSLTKADVQALLNKADYFEYLKEGEQISRLVFAGVVVAALIPAANALRQQQINAGDELGQAYTAVMTAQMFMQAMHMFWWYGTGAADNHFNAQQLMARNQELLRRTLRKMTGGHNVWDAFVATQRLLEKVGHNPDLIAGEAERPAANPEGAQRRVDSIRVRNADGNRVRVYLTERMGQAGTFDGFDNLGAGYELTVVGEHQMSLKRFDAVTHAESAVSHKRFKVMMVDPTWNFLTNIAGEPMYADGTLMADDEVSLWKRLDPELRSRFTPDALNALMSPKEVLGGQSLYDRLLAHDQYDILDTHGNPTGKKTSLVKELLGEVTFWWTEHTDSFGNQLKALFDNIKLVAPLEPGLPSGNGAYLLATSKTEYGQTLSLEGEGWNEFTGYIEGTVKPKGIWQDVQTAVSEYGVLYEAAPERGRAFLEATGQTATEALASLRRLIRGDPQPLQMDENVQLDSLVDEGLLDQAPPAQPAPPAEKPIVAKPKTLREIRLDRARNPKPEVREILGDNNRLLDLVPDATLLDLYPEYNIEVKPNGSQEPLPYSIRQESMSLLDAKGKPITVSTRQIGQYQGEAAVFAGGRYLSLLLSDALGVVASGVGIAAAVKQLDNLKADDPEGLREETRRMRALIEGEIAKQAIFLGAYGVLTGAHVGLAVTALPGTASAAVQAFRGMEHGLSLVASMAGSAMVLASELVNAITYAQRWKASGHQFREDEWGMNGSLFNAAAITLDTVLSAAFPVLALPLGISAMFLPNWAAIGAGIDIERNSVAALRQAGRDAEADMAETMAAASYRAGAPIYGWFAPSFTKEMVLYQLGQGAALRTLLGDDDHAVLGAMNMLRMLDIYGQLPPTTLDGDTVVVRRYSDTPTGNPVNLVVPLNEYLTGDGTQVSWAHSSHTGVPINPYATITEQAARLMAERLKAQRLDAGTEGVRNWFHVAFEERIAASSRSWESTTILGARRQDDLGKEVTALRARAASDREVQLSLDSHSSSTVAAYNLYQQVADSLGAHFNSAHLRMVGDDLYDGTHYLGNLATWQAQAAKDPNAAGLTETFTVRAERFQASLILAYFNERVVSPQIASYIAALDRTDPDFGLAQVDRLIGMLRTASSASDVFQIASRSEDFRFGRNAYDRTMAYSNYSAHAGDAHSGNVEWVDGSYLMHVGRPAAAADGRVAWWGDWQEPARPKLPQPPGVGATAEAIRAYNLAVAAYNLAADTYNHSLQGYLDSILARQADERGTDPGIPPIPMSALQAMDPGDSASADELAVYDDAVQSASATTTLRQSVLTSREQALKARYTRLQNLVVDGLATEEQRYAVSAALEKVGYALKTQVSGNTDNSVADRWVIDQSHITRDQHGLALGTEVRFLVRDEGGNTLRALEVDASAIDDLDQVFHVERGNVRLFSGDSDDTFVLSTAQDVYIDSGAGANDQALFIQATEGQEIHLDRFKGVVTVVGSAFKDTVRSNDEANHHYIDQAGTASGTPGEAGDDVEITGPGGHLIEIRAGRVLTGAGDDMVLVREHVGGTLDIDLGAGENVVSFAYLPGVRLQRDFSSGDYTFKQVTWVMSDGSVASVADSKMGWGLSGTLRNVQQVAGSEMGDSFEIAGGIHALQANGGDDRIVLLSGDVVVDGGAGADDVEVHGAHNTRVIMDDQGDLVTVASSVKDVMILVGAIAGAADAPSGAKVIRGTVDASASTGQVVVDVVDGTVTVEVGTGHTVINLLSTTARVVIKDHAGRADLGGTIEFNLLPDASVDDLALRRYLADSHAVVQGSTPTTSLLGGQVHFVIPPGPNHAYQGVSLKATNMAGQAVSIDLAQALPDADLPAAPASPLQVLTDGYTVQAWAGVRTVIDLAPQTHIQGAYSQADALAHRQAVQAQKDAALLRQARAQDTIDALGPMRNDPVFGDSIQAWVDAIDLTEPGSLQAWVAGGAQIDRWVINAADLVPGVHSAAIEDLHGALESLGWSSAQRAQLDAALDGRAAWSARRDTLVASQATVSTWRSALQACRQNWPGDAGMQATLDQLDAQLAAVPTTGAQAGQLHWSLGSAVDLVKDLASLGIITPAQAHIVTGIDLDLRGNNPPGLQVHSVAVNAQLSWADPAFQGLGVGAFDPTEPLAVQYGSEDHAVVVVDPTLGRFSISREGLHAWYVDAINQLDSAKRQAAALGTQLAGLVPYQLKLANGAALYTGLSNDTTHDTLEVDSATPMQQALLLQARNGDDTASTQLWLRVERFEGLTSVGGDGTDVMVASGAYANLLAGGRGMDIYTVRDEHDVVFENADEGNDIVNALGTSYTLSNNVEQLYLVYAGAPDDDITLHGSGNDIENQIYGHLDFANVLDGRGGADFMQGGHLDDVYWVDNALDFVCEEGVNLGDLGGNDWVYSSISYSLVTGVHLQGRIENLRLLGDGHLSATGNALANRLEGNAGHNWLDGGSGADTLLGGLGDDTYVVDNAGDVVTELANQGNDTVRASLSWTLGDHTENLVLTGSAHLNATGNALDNRLRGNSGKNRLDGGAGVDTVVLSGNLQDYRFLYTSTGEWAVGDKVASRDNVDRFSRVEAVFFEGSGQSLTVEQLIALGVSGAADVHLARAYVASHTDLMNAFGQNELNGLEHYFNYGHAEGRAVSFDPWQYMAANADIANFFNVDPHASAGHYIGYGRHENRAATSTLAIQRAGNGGANLYAQPGVASALFAGTGSDQLYGSSGNDALLGGAGDDTLDGGAGADRMGGGLGNDKYFVDNVGDIVYELANQGTDTLVSSVSTTLPDHVEIGMLTGSADLNLTGNSGHNTLLGNSGSNVLNGGAGTDTVLLDAPLSAYQFMRLSNGDVVMGPRDPGAGKADRLVGIELLQIMATGEVINLANLAMPTLLAYTASLSAAEMNTLGIDENAAVQHYITTGQPQGRTVTFDALRYMATNVDVPAVLGFSEYQAAKHYIQYGRHDGHAAPDASLVIQIGGQTGVTLTGQAGANDGLFGGNGNDTLNGGDGSDGLFGGAGNDVLDGGAGADRMAGGAGDDTYIVDNVGDVVYESLYSAQGTDTVISSVSYTLPNLVENGQLSGNADINLTGNSGDNVLKGNAGRNILNGGAGTDTVLLDAPLSDFQFLRQSNGDVLVGPKDPAAGKADRLIGIERLQIAATGEVIDLTTLAMPTVMDYLANHPEIATAVGTEEAVVAEHYLTQGQRLGWGVTTSFAMQFATSASGQTLNGSDSQRDALLGGSGNDALFGLAGDDVLIGRAGHDHLDGGEGNDVLIGGAGDDSLRGGAGDDTYRFARGDGRDTIEDGGSGLDRLFFDTNASGAIGFDQLWFSSNGYDVTVSVMGTQDAVMLWNWHGGLKIDSLTASDTTTSDPNDVRTLSAAGLEQLVSAMSTMTPPSGATSWAALSAAQQSQLQALGVWA